MVVFLGSIPPKAFYELDPQMAPRATSRWFSLPLRMPMERLAAHIEKHSRHRKGK